VSSSLSLTKNEGVHVPDVGQSDLDVYHNQNFCLALRVRSKKVDPRTHDRRFALVGMYVLRHAHHQRNLGRPSALMQLHHARPELLNRIKKYFT
jgi:hypothetical protein